MEGLNSYFSRHSVLSLQVTHDRNNKLTTVTLLSSLEKNNLGREYLLMHVANIFFHSICSIAPLVKHFITFLTFHMTIRGNLLTAYFKDMILLNLKKNIFNIRMGLSSKVICFITLTLHLLNTASTKIP